MSTIFSKTYSGKIKRVISEGQICPSTLPEYLIEKDIEHKDSVNYNYPSLIYNVEKSDSYVTVTTNTLAIKLTDKVYQDKPYYKMVLNFPNVQDIPENCVWIDGILCTNLEDRYIEHNNNLYSIVDIYNTRYFLSSDNISIKRLADKFKITIKNINTESFNLELKHAHVFVPDRYGNILYFYDCFIKHEGKTIGIFSNNFEKYKKVDMFFNTTNISLRDIPIGIIEKQVLGDYIKVTYDCYKTNLSVIVGEESVEVYFDTTLNKLSLTPSTISIYKVVKPLTKFISIETNPYTKLDKFKGLGEKTIFCFDSKNKYEVDKDIPLGMKRLIVDFKKLITSEKIDIISNDKKYYYTSPPSLENTLTTSPNFSAEEKKLADQLLFNLTNL